MEFFQNDFPTQKELIYAECAPIASPVRTITKDASADAIAKGDAFAEEIAQRLVSDFEKPGDQMVHVSTFIVMNDTVFVTYYANTKDPAEDPKNQTARFVYAPLNDLENKTFIDLQTTGHTVGGKVIDRVEEDKKS